MEFENNLDIILKRAQKSNIIIAQIETGKPSRYALVHNHIDLFHFIMSDDPDNHDLFSVIKKKMKQKPYFILDFPQYKFPQITEKEAYEYLKYTLDSIDQVMRKHKVPYSFEKHCHICCTHEYVNDFYKYRFHIVIDKWKHKDSSEARALYRCVLKELPKHIRDKKFLDGSIYSRIQYFPILFNRK